MPNATRDSPASIGGRGLKLRCVAAIHPAPADSPASIGGRGLKLDAMGELSAQRARFARQYWRAWIETPHAHSLRGLQALDSPASIGGRGLKQIMGAFAEFEREDSPASIGGRGLKRYPLLHSPGQAQIRPPVLAGVD